MHNFRPLFSLNSLKIHHKLPRKKNRPNDFLNGQKGYSHTPGGGCKGGAPCVENFVFDELKINSFRPFLSQNKLRFT